MTESKRGGVLACGFLISRSNTKAVIRGNGRLLRPIASTTGEAAQGVGDRLDSPLKLPTLATVGLHPL